MSIWRRWSGPSRSSSYILVCEIKIVTNILMGFKIWCQVGGGGTQFSKLPYIREFLNIWFQKLTDISYKRSLWTIFENFKNLSVFEAPTMSLRGPVLTLTARPEGPSLMGRVGRVVRVGRSPKVFLNFFKLCGYLELIYIYILVYEIKIVTNILMGFKMWCQVGGGGETFLIYRR